MSDDDRKSCSQVGGADKEPCSNPAIYRYTWPGKSEAWICFEHAARVRMIADAMGFPIQLIPLDPR